MPGRDRCTRANKPEGEAEAGRGYPAFGVRLHESISAPLQGLNLKSHVALASVYQPQLWYTRLSVEGGKALQVLGFRTVAHNLDHDIRRALHFGKPIGLVARGGNIAYLSALQGFPEHDHDVRFDGELDKPRSDASLIDKDLPQPSRNQGVQGGIDSAFDNPSTSPAR
jgi:hypothetical protein